MLRKCCVLLAKYIAEASKTKLCVSGISVDRNDTALFINKVLTLWKILNDKSFQIDKLRNDPRQAEIRSPSDTRFDFIIEFSKRALDMAGSQDNRKNNYPQTLLLSYIILAMELFVYVDTF